MIGELDVLGIVSERLEAAGIPFMLTGSFAMAYYVTPRMTRDIDLVVALKGHDVDVIVRAFSGDFYIDADDVRSAVETQRLFNLMHFASGIKVDLIVRKDSEYRLVEFGRRRAVSISAVKTWIVSLEDLILSKLLWAADSDSELQRRDVRSLLGAGGRRCLPAAMGGAARRRKFAGAAPSMNDTSPKIAAMIDERHRRMTPDERVKIAARMFDDARAIVEASLPKSLTDRERRLAVAQRFYGAELPPAALLAFADWPGTT